MRTPIFLAGAALVLLATQVQAEEACIPWDRLGSLKMIDQSTAEVKGGTTLYSVTMRTPCATWRQYGHYLIIDRDTSGTCFGKGQILRVKDGGACVVESVTPAQG